MENWKPIPQFEGLYECSDKGRIRSVMQKRGTRPNKLLNPYLVGTGYGQVALRKDGRYYKRMAHRLVAGAFLGPSELEVNHKNGKKLDNRLDNLEYVTPAQNLMHACRVLGKRRGPNHWNARLSEADVLQIRDRAARGETHASLAEEFGVRRITVTDIVSRRIWGYLGKA